MKFKIAVIVAVIVFLLIAGLMFRDQYERKKAAEAEQAGKTKDALAAYDRCTYSPLQAFNSSTVLAFLQ